MNVDVIRAAALAVIFAVLLDLFADRSTVLRWIVRCAACCLPPKLAQRCEEEWLGTLHALPLWRRPLFAIDLFRASFFIARDERARNAQTGVSNEPLRFTPAAPVAGVSVARQALIRWLSPPDRDSLTGALSRRHLGEHLPRYIERAHRSGRPLSVVLLDLDYFKRINDRYGHMAGDDVLRCLTLLLQASVGRRDLIVRYGGEEFVIVLADIDLPEAVKMAEKIRAACAAATMVTGWGELSTTASFGVAALSSRPGCAETVAEILGRADMALYKAKFAGRNCVRAAAGTSTEGNEQG